MSDTPLEERIADLLRSAASKSRKLWPGTIGEYLAKDMSEALRVKHLLHLKLPVVELAQEIMDIPFGD